ncbi:hypothetical protein BH11MYX4_BH11MYX4_32180 [soil metagenome]
MAARSLGDASRDVLRLVVAARPERALDHDAEDVEERLLDLGSGVALEEAERARDGLERGEAERVRLGAEAIDGGRADRQRDARNRAQAGDAVADLRGLAPVAVGDDERDRPIVARHAGEGGERHRVLVREQEERARSLRPHDVVLAIALVAAHHDAALRHGLRGEAAGVRGLAVLGAVHDEHEPRARGEPGDERAHAQARVHAAAPAAARGVVATAHAAAPSPSGRPSLSRTEPRSSGTGASTTTRTPLTGWVKVRREAWSARR